MPSKRPKLCGNCIEAAQNCLKNHFPNPLQIDLNIIDELLWKLNDPYIFKQYCRVANVHLPLTHAYESSLPLPPPPHYHSFWNNKFKAFLFTVMNT